jgi:hypothetical protein
MQLATGNVRKRNPTCCKMGQDNGKEQLDGLSWMPQQTDARSTRQWNVVVGGTSSPCEAPRHSPVAVQTAEPAHSK